MDDVDTLFPAQTPPAKGDVDSLFPPEIEQKRKAGVQSSPIQDLIFGDATVNPAARILNAFGEGFEQGWGTDRVGLSDESADQLKKIGLFNDYTKGQTSLVKAANEALIRPAAITLELLQRAAVGAFRGGQAVVRQFGEEVGAPNLAQEIAAIPEAFPTGLHGPISGMPVPGLGLTEAVRNTPGLIEAARRMRVIGAGERGWAGTAPVEEAKEVKAPPVEAPKPEQATGAPEQPQATTAPQTVPQQVPNIHAAARAAQPELFTRYDTAVEQQSALRSWLAEQPEGEAPVAQKRLIEINKEVDDLSPQVAQAYREAADKLGTPTVEPQGGFRSMAEMLAAQGDEAPGTTPAASEAAPRSIADQRAFIAGDVAQKLIAAGRPAEEAQASGAIVAARYETRAARFNGALGSAEDLYRREGPDIRGARGAAAPAAGEPPPQAPTGTEAGIDNSHTIRSGANSTPGGKVVIDQRIPEYSPILKDKDGNPANLHKYLAIHETEEAKAEAGGMPYLKAHTDVATPAERAAVEADGVSWKGYTDEIDGYLAKIEHEPNTNPYPGQLHVDPEAAIGHHRSENKAAGPEEAAKTKAEGYAPTVAAIDKSGMIENAEAYRAAAKKRREAGGGTVTVYKTLAQEARAHGMTVAEYGKEQKGLLAAAGEQFDAALTKADLTPAEIPADLRSAALDAMVHRGFSDPLDALDYATAKLEKDAHYYENLDAMLAAEHVIATEEGHDLHGKISSDAGRSSDIAGAEGRAQDQAAEVAGTREHPRQAGEGAQSVDEYFQHRPGELIRSLEGEIISPSEQKIRDELRETLAGAYMDASPGESIIDTAIDSVRELIEQGETHSPDGASWSGVLTELERRKAESPDATINAKGEIVPRRPQKELFQSQLGKVTLRQGERPIITLAKTADASTFIHETGHVFLEEIMRDAAHEAAPDVLKADAKTVRDWLGVQTDAEIKTRHHEKFARGFEQYLREGVAPSPELASVFAKFRDWLLRVYQTIKGLGSEITPDIRGVFDRLLAEEPQRTVIAPDLAKRPTLQDIHENDAVLTEPHEAERAGDRVVTEEARQRAGLPGDIADEHRSGAAEIGSGAREPGTLPPPSSASQVVTPGGLSSTELGAQLQGSGSAVSEGARTRAPQGPAGTIEPLPIGPHVPLDSLPAEKMDKVGNIRLENLNTPAAVNDSIRELYRANQARLDAATKGVVSDQSVMDLADAMGVDPRIVANNMDRMRAMSVEDGVPLAARIWLLRDMFTKLAAEVSKTMQGEDEAAYAEAKSRFLMVHETLSGVTAEMGRGLRAFRSMGAEVQSAKELAARLKGDEKTLFQLRQEMALGRAAETPAQIARMIAQPTLYQRFRSGVISYVINNLISGPITHATYSVGNAVLQLFHTGVEIPASALAGRVLSAVGAIKPEDRIMAAEVGPRLYGMVYGIGDGLIPAYNALKTGVSVMKGDPSGVDLFESEVAYRPQAIPGTAGYVLETPSRAVAAIHTMHYGMNYEAEISALAFRDATKQGLAIGSEAFNAHVANFRMNPPPDAMAVAHQEALDMVLMHKPTFGSGQYHFQKWVNSNLMVKLVMPFIQIGTNILREGFIERTPLAFLSKTARDNLLGRNGPAAMQTQYGQVMVGSGLAMTVFGLTAQGLMTGGGPSDPKQREVLEMTGWKPYSLKIGGEYIPYRKYLSALGPLVAGTSDMYEVGHTMSDEGLTKGAAALAFGFAEVVMDETWMRGLSSAIDAARHWDRDGAKYLRNFSMEFLPFSIGLRQISSLTDPVWREVRSEMDAARSHIPGMSSSLFPVRDLWGEPMRGGVMMAPSPMVNDPATAALQKAEYYPTRVERTISGVKLTDQQYDDYARIAGRDAHMRIRAMLFPGFDLLPLEARKEMLRSAFIGDGHTGGARDFARTAVTMKYPEIMQQALAAKNAQHQQLMH